MQVIGISPLRKEKVNFKSIYFTDFNYKYNYIRSQLEQEVSGFSLYGNNVKT